MIKNPLIFDQLKARVRVAATSKAITFALVLYLASIAALYFSDAQIA